VGGYGEWLLAWVNDLSNRIVALDSAPLIYYVEAHPVFFECLQPFFEALEQRRFEATTSTITIAEVLVHPFRFKRTRLVEAYHDLFATYLHVTAMSYAIAEKAASLRAVHNLETPDAIQLATALDRKADFFLTNDAKLSRLPQPQVLVLADLA
jgi:predicted nucleic acid-binding protein